MLEPNARCHAAAESRIYVLVGPNTASTTELTAQLLQEQRGAPIIGEASHAAAYAAEMLILLDGFGVMIPVDRTHLTLSGSSREGARVPIDLEVAQTVVGK